MMISHNQHNDPTRSDSLCFQANICPVFAQRDHHSCTKDTITWFDYITVFAKYSVQGLVIRFGSDDQM